MGLPVRADLVLRFGLEIAGVVALVQLFFRRPTGAVDHSPALDRRALADFLRPACQVCATPARAAISHPVAALHRLPISTTRLGSAGTASRLRTVRILFGAPR